METILIDGCSISCKDLIKVYKDCEGEVKLALHDTTKERIKAAREGVEKKIKSGETVYGTNTNVSALKSAPAPSGRGTNAQAAGYAGTWDKYVEHYDTQVCRVAWVILVSGFAKGTTVVTLNLVKQIMRWLNMAWNKNNKIYNLLPRIEKGSSVGFADVIAPTRLHVETLAKYQIVSEDKAVEKEYEFASGEVLALLSNNCFTLAEAVVTVNQIEETLKIIEVGTALDMEAEEANLFIISEAAQHVAQWDAKKKVIERLRSLLGGSELFKKPPSSIHPYVSLRASTDILGTAWEAIENTKHVLEELINAHQSNPVVVGPWNSKSSDTKIGPVAQFDSTRLFWGLSNLQQAIGCLTVSLGQRTLYRINKDGFNIPQFFTRRMLIYNEAALRDSMVSAQVLSPAMCRMNGFHDYDWAGPAAQACSSLAKLVQDLKRVVAVNLVISCAVVEYKQGDKAGAQIGEGCREVFSKVQEASFDKLPETEPFSFKNLFDSIKL